MIASLIGGVNIVYKGFTYPGKKTHDFQSNPINYPEDYYNHSMGCVLLGECKVGVVEIKSLKDVEVYYSRYLGDRKEFDAILSELNKAGSKVYIPPSEYFPIGHRGVYHTVSNNFYLNDQHVHRYGVLMSVMRHEGWQHKIVWVVLSITISLLLNQKKKFLKFGRRWSEELIQKPSRPWEKEITWAGKTEGMTLAFKSM